MSEEFIPYGKQWIDDEDIRAVVDVLNSDFLTTGPKIKEFEEKFAKYIGCKYAVAISNGTAALHAACYAANIKAGDEVITTPITFAASANCVRYLGGTPVFTDIDPKTYNIDPNEIRKKITPKTKAIIPVHFTGQVCNMEEIKKIAKEHNLIVIEDGAHVLGGEYKNELVGHLSDMTTFSFHPVKHITTGEGGMITTDNKELYDRLILFRTHGITRNMDLLENKENEPWYYEQLELGYNYRITDIQCALGISQLNRLDNFVKRRRKIVEIYNREFNQLDGVIIPYQDKNQNSSYHLYVLQLELEKLDVDRKEIFNELRSENIGVNVHYIPVYYFPYYKNLGYKKGICPKAEALYERIITIPLYPKMTDEEVFRVIDKIKKVIKKHRK